MLFITHRLNCGSLYFRARNYNTIDWIIVGYQWFGGGWPACPLYWIKWTGDSGVTTVGIFGVLIHFYLHVHSCMGFPGLYVVYVGASYYSLSYLDLLGTYERARYAFRRCLALRSSNGQHQLRSPVEDLTSRNLLWECKRVPSSSLLHSFCA